ncbi:MAG: hypothetical protein KGZ74_15810, partial [Chitinophagaceae bacterium]|nr:hypothetical protein [Chitinophagaceae bacterium]
MKQISTLLVMLILAVSIQAQSTFFKQVSYRGAFAPAPTPMWTNSWTNWDPNSTAYGTPTVTISGEITSNRTLDRDTVYLLSGLVFVKGGATLTIESGTIIRGNNAVANSALVITRGSKLNAIGTVAQPIVFTSSKAAGTRAPGDWGGIILLGNATVNTPGGVANIEGLTVSADTQFGGGGSPNDNESSGTLQYVRIEFGGFDFATDNEINGLTMGGIGRGTTIDHIQVSFNDDDCFEWFGGTVNCAYLVAYRGVDDNWDTDFGYSGSVQFCLGVRDPNLSDLSSGSSSEGFESDNDATGSSNTPKTSAIFSNVTELGPFRGTGAFPGGQDFVRGARIRRNSELKIFNSIITDYPRAMTINEATVLSNFRNNLAKLENNIFGAYTTALFDGLNAGTVSLRDSLFRADVYKNDSLPAASAADDLLATPWSYTSPDYRPTATIAQTGAEFNDPVFTGRVQNTSANFVIPTAYRGAFAPTPAAPWTDGWVNWDPQNTAYGAPTVTISGTISSNRILDRDTVYLLSGLVFVKNGATLTIESGTVIRGDNAVANSALVITRGSKLNALGTATAPIVFTSSKAAGTRAPGDWGGVILLGNGIVNVPGGVGNIEGLTVSADTQFGGTDSLDNSGVIQYVRIEYGGFDFATDNEINGLTMGGIGRGTTIDHIQVSFNDDDCFEWFGGNVNCSYLVAYRGVDDNWDTDFGYSGIVQFCLGVRDPNLSDLSTGSSSEGFESDNDATGSNNTPKTSAIFTNVTEIGPFRGTGAFPGGQDFVRGARIRRNSELKIFNSIITDYPRAMTINEATVLANFRSNKAKLENNIFGAYTTALFDGLNAGTVSLRDSLFNNVYKNDSVVSLTAADDLLQTPYNYLAPDYRPTALLATTGASFADEVFTGVVSTCPTLAPGTITGPANVAGCVGNIVYTVSAVPGAELYTWTVPTHFTIVSGQGTNTLTVTVNNSLFVSGTVSVNASASCGSSAVSTLSVIDVVPTAPGTITGGPLNVCAIAGTPTQVTYSVPAVNGASSYLWVAPAG